MVDGSIDDEAAARELARAELRREKRDVCGCPMFQRTVGEWITAHVFTTCTRERHNLERRGRAE